MHARIAGILRAVAVLSLLVALAASAGLPGARAQDDATATPLPTETAVPEGTLVLLAASCVVETDPPAPVAILTDAELAEQPSCTDAPSASVSVDGGDAFDAASGDEVALPVGAHTLTELSTGASHDVDIVEGAASTLVVVTFVVVPPTEVPADTPTDTPTQEPATEAPTEAAVAEVTAAATETATAEGEIQAADVIGHVTLVTHLCRQGIATTDDLGAIDTWGQRLAACPVVVLPDDLDVVSDDAVTAPPQDPALTYDQTVTYKSGSQVYTKSLAKADFKRAALCESDVGEDLNGAQNGCYDQSGYRFRGIPPGTVTVNSVTAPGTYAFLTGEADPHSADVSNGLAGTVTLDTSGDGDVTVHLFYAPKPIRDRVTIVAHLCPSSIQSRSDFNKVGNVNEKLDACQSITRAGDVAPRGGKTSGQEDFDITVQGAGGQPERISASPFAFEPRTVCERDLPESLDDNPRNDLCLDESGYVADGITQGRTVRVNATKPPDGAHFLAAETGPDPDDDDATITHQGTTGLTKFDTTQDGNVVVHVFFAPDPVPTATPTKSPIKTPTKISTRTSTQTPRNTPVSTPVASATSVPTSTPTPDGSGNPNKTPAPAKTATKTPTSGGMGSVKILKFVCDGDESLSRINVIPEGQTPTLQNGLLGDATCLNANIQYAELVLADGSTLDAALPSEGVRTFTNIPATSGNQQHTFNDTRWGLKAKFTVEAGKQTVLVSLTYEPPEVPDISDPPNIPEPNIPEDAAPLPPSVGSSGDPSFPDEEDGNGVPNPVEDPAADPFGNIDETPSPEEVKAEQAAQAEVAKVNEGKDLPTVGTPRATADGSPLWLVVAGLGMVVAGLATRRRHRGQVG